METVAFSYVLYKNEAIDEAKRSIDNSTKIKVVFPNTNVIVIEGKNDNEHIFTVRNEISNYIYALDFGSLEKIKLSHVIYYTEPFGSKCEENVPYLRNDLDRIISSLKIKIMKNLFCMNKPLFECIINEYVCDFLSLDDSFFDNNQNPFQSNNSEPNKTPDK